MKKGSLRDARTTSAHMLEYLRYDIPAMRQYACRAIEGRGYFFSHSTDGEGTVGRDGFVTGLGAHAPKSWQRPTSLWRTVARGALARSERARCEAIGFGCTRDEASDAKSYEFQS